MENLKDQIAKRLIELRIHNRYTQIQAAAGCNVKTKTYQTYEYAIAEPSITTLVCLAKFYGLATVDELITGDKKNNHDRIIKGYRMLKPEVKRIVDLILNQNTSV